MVDNRYGAQGGFGGDRDRDRVRGGDEPAWRDEGRARAGWGPADTRRRDRDDEEERGFFERAGDEIRSWFGDEDDDDRRGFGRDRANRGFDQPDRFGRSGDQRGHPQSWGEADRGQDWRGSSRQGSGSYGSGGRDFGGGGRHFGYNDMSGMMGGFGNQRFGSSQDDHYRSWRDRQIEQLDRDYQDYCRENEQQFHSSFDQWRQKRQAPGSGEKTTATGSASQGASGQGGASGGLTAGSPSGQASDSSFIGGGSDPSAATAGGGGDPTPEPATPGGTRGGRSRG